MARRSEVPKLTYAGRRYGLYSLGYYRTIEKPYLYLHRQVWEAHHGPIPEGWHIHHRDGNRANNAISNLEAKSPGGHIRDHLKGKIGARGEACSTSKLTEAQAKEIKARYIYHRPGVVGELAREFHISSATVWAVANGKRWLDLGPPSKPPPPTSCRRGHPYTEDNSYVSPRGYRTCRICNRMLKQAWRRAGNKG